MSKVLQRAMFKKPQHEHRSTGIASGLEYREQYAVGGRVGYKTGKLVVNEAALNDAMSGFNPNVSIGAGPNLSSGITQANVDLAKSLSLDDLIAQEQARREGILSPIDYSKYSPTALDAITGAATTTLEELLQPLPSRTIGERPTVATFIKNLGKEGQVSKERRRELDMLADAEKRADTKDTLLAAETKFAAQKAEEAEKARMDFDREKFEFDKKKFEDQLKLDKQLVEGELAKLEKDTPNVWTYVTGMVEASGIDINNPASWSKEDMQEIKNFMSYATGEKSEEGIAADMAAQKAKIVSSAFNSLGDDQQRRILGNPAEMQKFFDTINPLLSVAGVEGASGMPDLNVTGAYIDLLQDSGRISSLLSSKGLQNPLAERSDLYTLASTNQDAVFILDGLQKAFAAVAEGRITEEDLQGKIAIANAAFAQIDSSIEPIQ